MSNCVRQPPLLRRPARVADPGEMVDLRVKGGSWRQGSETLCAHSITETGEVLIWICTEYGEARWEDRRAVGIRWPAKRMRVSPSPRPWRSSYRHGRSRGRARPNKEGREP
jgi:hypothetical protein